MAREITEKLLEMGIAKEDIISTCQLSEIKQKFIKTLNSWFNMTSASIAPTELGKIDLHSKLERKHIFCYPSSGNFDIEPIHKISKQIVDQGRVEQDFI